MLVRHRMTANPVTVTPQDTLATAQEKMEAGRFRRLPVVQESTLTGILTDRDVRRHIGVLERTRVRAAMTESPLTISPLMTVEEAVQLMLKHQIGGLPVLDEGNLVGIITTSDVMHAFLEVTGAATPGSVRIDLAQSERGGDLAEAVKLVNEMGGEVLGVGTYRDPRSEQLIFYLRLRGVDAAAASTTLQNKGYTVLSVQ